MQLRVTLDMTVTAGVNQSKYRWLVDSGGLNEPCVRWGPAPPPGEMQYFGACTGPLRSIGNIRREPKLFARWQQRCGLSLSLLQQLVVGLHVNETRCQGEKLKLGAIVQIAAVLYSTNV